DLFLRNRCANLHSSSRLGRNLTAHLARGERSTMHTIAPCASTQHNDTIPRLYSVGMATVRQKPETPTEHERVIDITWMIKKSPINSGNTHLVTIITHTINDSASDAPRWENTRGKFIRRSIEWPETKHIGTSNRLSRNPEHITYHAAHTRIRSTKRLNR